MEKFKNKLTDVIHSPAFASIFSSIICILLGIIVGFLILLVTNAGEAFEGIFSLIIRPITPSFFNAYFIGAIAKAAPIVLSGFAVLFAFKTGMFNIGTPGQMLIGGFTAVAITLTCPIHNSFTFILAALGGIAAGAIWGSLIGFLKAYFHVHEVIAGIMLNYIATYIVAFCVKLPQIYNPAYAETKPVPEWGQVPTWGLDKLFSGSYLDISIFIVIIIGIIIYLVLNKTTLGFQLKATGFNKDAANNASMKYKRNIILSMLISGALCGLGGALLYCSSYSGGIKPAIVLLPQGFDGISVALLASLHPIGAIFTGTFIQLLRSGGQIIRLYTSYSTEVADIIIAIIIYFSALTVFIKSWLSKRKRKKETVETVKEDK